MGYRGTYPISRVTRKLESYKPYAHEHGLFASSHYVSFGELLSIEVRDFPRYNGRLQLRVSDPMGLPAGTLLGAYEILCAIGAGGMGEVYEARDNKLGRNVAIKVLPEAFAHDSERLARFEREARMLAALNHPNIATIFGLEQSGGVHYLVMELVPGQTLAERLTAGPLGVEEALQIGRASCRERV